MNIPGYIRDLSIKNKLIILILFVSFVVMALGFTIISIWGIRQYKSENLQSLDLDTKLIGDYSIVPLTFNDNEQASKILSRFNYIENVDLSVIYDNEGNVFAVYPPNKNTSELPVFDTTTFVGFRGKEIIINEPIIFDNVKYGQIFVKANKNELVKMQKKYLMTFSALLVLLVFIVLFLAIKGQSFISKPILKLKKHIDDVAQRQDFSAHITKQNNDEIGSVFDGFNNFIHQIQISSKERDYALERLNDSQDKLNLALQGGEIGIWEWDLKSDLTTWDARMEKMFGLAEGTFEQSYDAFKKCLHPDDIEPTQKIINDALKGLVLYDTVYRAIWKNGEIKYIRAKATVSRNEKGEPLKMIGVCFDVTEIKKAEVVLNEHREKLEKLVHQRTKELEKKYKELESMNEVFVGREFRIKELKDKINELVRRDN